MEQTPSRRLTLSRRSALTAVAAGAVTTQARRAQAAVPTTARPVLDALLHLDGLAQEAMTRTGTPGMAITVVHQDAIVYRKGFGRRETGKPETVDPDTVFQLASVSKPVASTVMAALAGDGLINWDDPIIRHDPGFALHDPWVTSQVTLRDMFCHRSGLPDHAGDRLEDLGYDRSQVLSRLRYVEPGSSFRSRYAYTNFGLTAAAVAAASASGKSWEDLSADRLYRPLGMRRTSSRFADFASAANRARLHMRIDGKWIAKATRDADAQSPAGGVSSSARDLGAWMRLQLNGGLLAGAKIVEPDALAETHRPQMIRAPAPKDPAVDRAGLYGLGWNVDYDAQGHIRLGHSGAFNLGAATAVSLLPNERLGIIVLTNAQPVGAPEAVCRSFLDLALTGKVERDWLALFQQVFKTAMAPDYGAGIDYAHLPTPASPALPLAAYVGSYRNDLFGKIEIVAFESGLALKLGPTLVAFPMQHFDRDVFTYQPTDENAYGRSAVAFSIGASRKATTVTIEDLNTDGQGIFRRA